MLFRGKVVRKMFDLFPTGYVDAVPGEGYEEIVRLALSRGM